MKKRRSLRAFSLLMVATLFMSACGSSGSQYVLPTLAPRNTPTPEVQEDLGPTATPAPDANNLKIIALDGEDFNQTANFSVRGTCSISVKKVAGDEDFAFCVADRDAATDCVYLDFTDTEGNLKNVSGKMVHVAAWVYQETGLPADFACRLTGKRPDGITETPESITISRVPSGQWTLIEGDIPIYSNLINPNVSIEMTSSKDNFYFDDIRLTYDPYSAIPANTEYGASNFDGVFCDFENSSMDPFVGRDDGTTKVKAEITGDSFEGSNALYVSDRASNWYGIQVDLTQYNLAGSKIWVSFAAKHEAKHKARVICSMQWTAQGSSTEKYNNIVSTDTVLPDTWTEASGTYTIPSNASTVIIYFEAEDVNSFYLDDIVISGKDPSAASQGGQDVPQGGQDTTQTGPIDTTGFVTIHSLSAKSENETQIFTPRGSTLEINKKGYSGSCFEVTGRTQAWNGIGIDFTNLDNKSFDVIGKEVYVSFWIYHESGSPMEFSATLQANKPDGTQVWPERVSVEGIPSGKWTFVEGIIPVYANVKVPQINFELPGSDTEDFLVDEITIAYNPKSSVDPNPDYEEAAKVKFSPINLTFEDNNAFFQSRGTGTPKLVYGGHASDMCLMVTGRTANWHGVQADLSQYDLAGKTIDISYWAYHEYSTPLEIKMTAEQNDGETTNYTTAVPGDTNMGDGKWVKFSNTFDVPANTKKLILYFESPIETAEFYIDDVSIKLQ